MAAMAGLSTAAAISQQQEVQIGAQQAQQVNAQLPIVQDPDVNRYLNILGDSLAHVTSRGDLDWHFYMVNTNDFNAFALPGGYIYVNRGVAERSDKLDQFASVIGARDRTRRAAPLGEADGADAGRQRRRHGRLCADRASATAGSAQAGINVAGAAVFAKFSRDDEAQADAAGVDELVRAGINPNGMPEMFEKLLAERQARPVGARDVVHRPPARGRAASRRRESGSPQINPAILRTLTDEHARRSTISGRGYGSSRAAGGQSITRSSRAQRGI